MTQLMEQGLKAEQNQVLEMMRTLLVAVSCADAKSFSGKIFGVNPRVLDSLAIFLASPSALPVWEPKRMNNGSPFGVGAAVPFAASGALPTGACRPARKPLSQARCSVENGAFSGMKGTEFIQQSIKMAARPVERRDATAGETSGRLEFDGGLNINPVRILGAADARDGLINIFTGEEMAVTRFNLSVTRDGITGD